MDYNIIDFHTHPFLTENTNICSHIDNCNMSAEKTKEIYQSLGVEKICGSVISKTKWADSFDEIRRINDEALELREMYNGFYVPGFHVHPAFVRESCEEIDRMHALGVNLIGELVPYYHGWDDYSCENFSKILDYAEKYDMLVSFHSAGNDAMDKMVQEHPGVRFVAAHPGEYRDFCRHMDRMKMSDNYCLDVSGYGIFRYGMLRHAIDLFGADRFLFGSDYPTCSPAMYIGGVRDDLLLTDDEKEKILYLNAKRLLKL